MNEDEKQAVERMKNLLKYSMQHEEFSPFLEHEIFDFEKVLNLIEKQEKEIKELKNINKKLNCENQKLFEETIEQQKEIEELKQDINKLINYIAIKEDLDFKQVVEKFELGE